MDSRVAFVMSSSKSKSNNTNIYLNNILLCNYDVTEKSPVFHTLTYDVKP